MKITAQEEYGLRCLLRLARVSEANELIALLLRLARRGA